MGLAAQVVVNIPTRAINQTYSYAVPDEFDYIEQGWRILVPFGPRKVEGFVLNIAEEDTSTYKSILAMLDDEPWFDANMLKTAKWLSQYYLCSLAEAMRLFVPGKSGIKTQKVYCLSDGAPQLSSTDLSSEKTPLYSQVVDFIANNPKTTLLKLEKQFGASVQKVVRFLIKKDVITAIDENRRSFKTRYQSFVQLSMSEDSILNIDKIFRGKAAQKRAILFLLQQEIVPLTQLRQLDIGVDTIKRLHKAGYVTILEKPLMRDSYSHLGKNPEYNVQPQQLTEHQQKALNQIKPAIDANEYKSFLLHGVTGSGKTEVYIESVAAVRAQGRQAIVLVPEIALTGQAVKRFKSRFGEDVVVIHSKLSVGERYDAWRRLRSQDAGIVIGARSAIFAPVINLGVIILDEEHEFTYKQEESPRYHTRDVALTRANLARAVVILGSATPSVETFYQASVGKHILLNMPNRIDGSELPKVSLVDMREELAQGRRNVISPQLQELLISTHANGGQAIVLINRRGYSTFVLCRQCGHVLRCRHCDVSLVFHSSDKTVRCHYCQQSIPSPDVCPACGSHYIRYFGTGTQKVEEELAKLLPTASIVRMDQDTTTGKMSHDSILNAFAEGTFDVLLGTQMVAKGHDVRNVTAVGIITADTALNLPDFRAAEKTFALLTQAAGRAGRGEKPGRVVVQTYNPEHYAIVSGAAHDYATFYDTEIIYRRQLGYPPFTNIIKITVQANDENQVFRDANKIANLLKSNLEQQEISEVIGPFPAPIAKVQDVFRMNILVKSKNLPNFKQHLVVIGLANNRNVIIDVDPVSLL